MNKGFFLVVFAGVLFTACSSLPVKKGPEESLVVVKFEVVNKSVLPISRDFWFDFSSDYPSVRLPRDSGFVVFVVKEPAVRIVSIGSMPANGFTGNSITSKVDDLVLPYSAGHLVVADFVFTHTIQDRGHGAMSYPGLRRITDWERDDLLRQLTKSTAGGWEP